MKHFITVSSAMIYRQPTFHSEADTQVVLGEEVAVLEKQNDFTRIRCEDGYEGWVNRHQLTAWEPDADWVKKMLTQDLARIHLEADTDAPALRDAVAGSYLFVTNQDDGWNRVVLPGGVPGWVRADAFETITDWKRVHLVSYAQRFLGIPYLWAGKTVKGFDCSGFTQFVHKMFGISIRRDAWMQFEDGAFVSDNPLEGQPGDLLFFAESGSRVTHVGFCLGKGRVLHARGMVRVNSLDPQDPLFSAELLKDFVGVRSFL
jgi:cell wall-associated NlpC family hydrolase